MNDWRAFLQDNGFEVIRDDYQTYADSQGTPFVIITSAGVKESHAMTYPGLFANPELAWKKFEDELLLWLKGRRRIHVRTAPTIHSINLHEDPSIDNGYVYHVVMARLTAY